LKTELLTCSFVFFVTPTPIPFCLFYYPFIQLGKDVIIPGKGNWRMTNAKIGQNQPKRTNWRDIDCGACPSIKRKQLILIINAHSGSQNVARDLNNYHNRETIDWTLLRDACSLKKSNDKLIIKMKF
jgi:hypothetical protein